MKFTHQFPCFVENNYLEAKKIVKWLKRDPKLSKRTHKGTNWRWLQKCEWKRWTTSVTKLNCYAQKPEWRSVVALPYCIATAAVENAEAHESAAYSSTRDAKPHHALMNSDKKTNNNCSACLPFGCKLNSNVQFLLFLLHILPFSLQHLSNCCKSPLFNSFEDFSEILWFFKLSQGWWRIKGKSFGNS